MITIHIRDEYIRLGQAMKLAGLTDNGSQAKEVIQGGEVSVNGETETRRGRKLRDGDVFFWKGQEVRVEAPDGGQ